jgi:hypothetical protein
VAGGPPLELLAAWPRTSPPDACPNPPIVFAREFFVSASKERNAELATALRPSLRGNPCGLHRFVVSDAAWASNLEEFQKEAGVAVEVYYAQLILMAHLFEAAGLKSPLGGGPGSVFVASTADVAVPNMDAVPVACGDAFKPQRRAVLVMSRVDMHKKEMDCERYKALGSFDVYVAAADLVTPQVGARWGLRARDGGGGGGCGHRATLLPRTGRRPTVANLDLPPPRLQRSCLRCRCPPTTAGWRTCRPLPSRVALKTCSTCAQSSRCGVFWSGRPWLHAGQNGLNPKPSNRPGTAANPAAQVEHYHKTDRGPMWRTRVNHADNNAEPRGALYSVCDLEKL